MILQISQARLINQYLGGAVVGPWDMGQLNDEWMDTFQGLAFDLQDYKNGTRQVEDLFAKWRQRMNYR